MRRNSVPAIIASIILCAALLLVAGIRKIRDSDSRQEKGHLLQQAVERGDVKAVRSALQIGADPRTAIESPHPSLAGLFLRDRGAPPPTPLIVLAAGNGNTEVVRALLERGADPNARGSDDRTALMQALLAGHTSSAQALLDKGADINAVDKDGKTALILSLQSDQGVPVARFLMARGADVKRRAKDGDTALRAALIGDKREIVDDLLQRGADANIRGIDATGSVTISGVTWSNAGGTALMWAAGNSQTGLMEALLNHGADINAKDLQGRTALMWAALFNHADAARLLLQRGADADIRDAHGQTALIAARSVRARNVETILQKSRR